MSESIPETIELTPEEREKLETVAESDLSANWVARALLESSKET